MKIIFIRHGEPDYSIDSLTEKGWREAYALAKRIQKWEVKEFYVSPLGRAQDTAKAGMSKLDRQAVTLDWLEEFRARVDEPISGRRKVPWDFFPEHWTKDDRYYERDHWMEGDIMTREVKAVYDETCQGLDALLKSYGYVREGRYYRVEQHNDDTIVLFCHMGIIAAMMCHLTGIPMPLLMHGFFLAPTSVSVVQTEERKDDIAYFRCQVFGDTKHLHDANEPISSSGYYAEAFQG